MRDAAPSPSILLQGLNTDILFRGVRNAEISEQHFVEVIDVDLMLAGSGCEHYTFRIRGYVRSCRHLDLILAGCFDSR